MATVDQVNAFLALPLKENDSGAATPAGYLYELLAKVWLEGEGFNGKRPWGNGGWQHDLYSPMIRAGLIDGELEHDHYVITCDTDAGDDIILAAMRRLLLKAQR